MTQKVTDAICYRKTIKMPIEMIPFCCSKTTLHYDYFLLYIEELQVLNPYRVGKRSDRFKATPDLENNEERDELLARNKQKVSRESF